MYNKSAAYHTLQITVLEIESDRVKYKLTHGGMREFTWVASTLADYRVTAKLQKGARHNVEVHTDRHGTQHWLDAQVIGGSINKTAVDNFVEY